MDALSLLRLQVEWGADEALADAPLSRLQQPAAPEPPRPAPPVQPVPVRPAAVQEVPATASAPPRPAPPPRPAAMAARGPAVEAAACAAEATDLAGLGAVIASFTHCPLRDTATRSVLPVGSATAAIAIVGEVPDEDEDRAGHPFAGRAGDLLDRMLGSIDLKRGDVLLLPLIPWRPPGGRAPSPGEIATCLPFLEHALALSNARLLLCMGGRPARLLADSTIRSGAGFRKPSLAGLPDETRLLLMRHPSYLLSHLSARREAWADLIRVRLELDKAKGS